SRLIGRWACPSSIQPVPPYSNPTVLVGWPCPEERTGMFRLVAATALLLALPLSVSAHGWRSRSASVAAYYYPVPAVTYYYPVVPYSYSQPVRWAPVVVEPVAQPVPVVPQPQPCPPERATPPVYAVPGAAPPSGAPSPAGPGTTPEPGIPHLPAV